MKFTDPADAPEAKTRLESMAAEISAILTLDVGLDVLGTPVSCDLSLITTHASAEALVAYQEHPVHLVFRDWVGTRLAGRWVVDSEG